MFGRNSLVNFITFKSKLFRYICNNTRTNIKVILGSFSRLLVAYNCIKSEYLISLLSMGDLPHLPLSAKMTILNACHTSGNPLTCVFECFYLWLDIPQLYQRDGKSDHMIRSGFSNTWVIDQPKNHESKNYVSKCLDVTKISNVAVPIHSFITTETITNLLDFSAVPNYTDKTC